MDLKIYFLAIVPMFVAADPIGMLPIFLGLTERLREKQRRKIATFSVIAAFIFSICFVFIGKSMFNFLGITMNDFMIAGGVLLFLLAAADIMGGVKSSQHGKVSGIVPIGVPLIAGPAVLTTALMLVDLYGVSATIVSILINFALVLLVLLTSSFWIKLLGKYIAEAMSKIMNLLLAAIAVMLIRKGFEGMLAAVGS